MTEPFEPDDLNAMRNVARRVAGFVAGVLCAAGAPDHGKQPQVHVDAQHFLVDKPWRGPKPTRKRKKQ